MASISNARRWGVVILLALGMIISYIDRTNFSVVLSMKDFRTAFGLQDVDRGLLNSAFFWTYALLQIPAGILVDRAGVKWPYAAAFVLWSLFSALTATCTTFTQLFAVRLALGAGEALVTPASLRWIRFNVPETQRGTAVGILFAGAKFGPAVGNYLATVLTLAYGWRAMFMILGFGALVWLVPWILLVRDDDRKLEHTDSTQTAIAPVALSRILRTPLIWGVMIGTFAYNYFVYFCVTWLPSYFVEQRHLSLSQMGVYSFFTFFGMGIMAILAGMVADRMIARGGNAIKIRKAFTCAGFAIASTEIIGAYSGSNTVALAFAIISLTGLGLATANYWALTQAIMPGGSIGRIAGLQNFASNLSGIFAPLITGWLKAKTGSYEAPMLAIWMLLITGLLAYIFLVRKKYATV